MRDHTVAYLQRDNLLAIEQEIPHMLTYLRISIFAAQIPCSRLMYIIVRVTSD